MAKGDIVENNNKAVYKNIGRLLRQYGKEW